MMNEIFGWAWVVLGFLSGTLLGLRFHQEDWLGGYGSFRRRMVRLGHISFLGLGFLNILFAHTAGRMALDSPWLSLASGSLVIGGLTMPICCGLMAWRQSFQPLFVIPVVSLSAGAMLALIGLTR